MSIIHEALKKVQANLQKRDSGPVEQIEQITTQPVPEQAVAAQPPAEHDAAKPRAPLPMALTATAVIIAALWLLAPQAAHYLPHIKIPFKLPGMTIKTPAFAHGNKPSAPLAQIIIPPAAGPMAATAKTAAAPNPAVFNVQGIMTNDGSTVALINGKIYERGDEIEGTKIVGIGVDAIIISRDGKEETIQVKH